MGFFDRFRSKKKVPSKSRVSLEEQLKTLADFGIRPKYDDFLERCEKEWGSNWLKFVESDPYDFLLRRLGDEHYGEFGEYDSNSDNVFYFDTECDDEDVYDRVFTRLSVLSRGLLTEITGTMDHDDKRSYVSFRFNDKRYDWELTYNDDWFDCESIDRLNVLLKDSGSVEFFYVSVLAQDCVIVFAGSDIIERLNDLLDYPFFLDTSWEGYKHQIDKHRERLREVRRRK